MSETARASSPPRPEPRRCTASDLRLQWSSAHQQRARDPGALSRLRERVEAALAAVNAELAAATDSSSREALAAELAEIRQIADAVLRLDP